MEYYTRRPGYSSSSPDLLDKGYQLDVGEVKSVKVEIVLGQINKNCLGHGICRIINTSAKQKTCKECIKIPAIIEKKTNHKISIRFEKEKVSDGVNANHFNENFILETPFELPVWLCRKFNMGVRNLKAGRYAVIEESDYLLVVFPMIKAFFH